MWLAWVRAGPKAGQGVVQGMLKGNGVRLRVEKCNRWYRVAVKQQVRLL